MWTIAALMLLTRLGYSLAASVTGIKVDINVPSEAELGRSVDLKCSWKLSSNSTLYTVKWYKDEHEFFSYNPDNSPQERIKIHPQNGVNIDVTYSNENLIWLTNLSLSSSGQYKCEVSTGPPFFKTNYLQKNLTVIALPSQGPEIRGLSSHYAPGENVTATCTSWPSVPKAKLYWTINNRTVPPEYIVQHPEHPPMKGQGTPNSLGLRFELESRRDMSLLKVRCIAHVGSRRYETEKHVQMAHANNQRFSANDPRSGSSTSYIGATLILVLATTLAT